MHALEEIQEDFNSRGIDIFFTGIKGPLRDKMIRSGFMNKVKEDHFFMSIQEAVNAYDSIMNMAEKSGKFKKYVKQTNK